MTSVAYGRMNRNKMTGKNDRLWTDVFCVPDILKLVVLFNIHSNTQILYDQDQKEWNSWKAILGVRIASLSAMCAHTLGEPYTVDKNWSRQSDEEESPVYFPEYEVKIQRDMHLEGGRTRNRAQQQSSPWVISASGGVLKAQPCP